jgi:hypothetical protein
MRARPLLAASVAALLAAHLGGCGGPEAVPGDAPDRAPAEVPALVALLEAEGVEAVAFDAGSLLLKRGWLQVPVFVEDGGASLQAVFPHTGRMAPLDPGRLARWNATRRFGRAYLDEDGRPVLASDLLLGAGVGGAAVVQWSRLVLEMAAVFAREVWPVPVPTPDSPASPGA